MEFLTQPPAVLPPALNQYSALAVIKLAPATGTGHPGHPLRRRSSLGLVASGGTTGFSGSLGASYGGGYGGGGGGGGGHGEEVGTEGRPGGGLRRILSRTSGQAHHRDNTGAGTGTGGSAIDDTPGAALSHPGGGAAGKVGKWQAKVAVGTTATHLVMILSPGEILTPVEHSLPQSPRATTGSGLPSAGSFSGSGSGTGTGTGAHESAVDDHDHEHDGTEGGGIGGKIKSLLGAARRRSSLTTPTTASTTKPNATSTNTTATGIDPPHPTLTTAGTGTGTGTAASSSTAEPNKDTNSPYFAGATGTTGASGLASQDKSYPSHIGGQPVSYITVPLAAIEQEHIKMFELKNDIIISIPVHAHFSRFANPASSEMGRDNDDSWGRTGTIKFLFDSNWLGAKAEADVLLHNIEQSITNTQAMTA